MSFERPTQNKPTLEELLEVKRAERPPEVFWSEFDARLREKQLAALIPVSSLWSRIFSNPGRIAKLGLPLAATAAVAIGFVSLDFQPAREGTSSQPGTVREVVSAGFEETSETAPIVGPVEKNPDSGRTSPIRTVVIEVASKPAEASVEADSVKCEDRIMNAAEISKALPWLSNVDFKAERDARGLQLIESLHATKVTSSTVLNVFSTSVPASGPAWLPTEQHIRAVVASELGIGASYPEASSTLAHRTIASSSQPRLVESRLESEYRGDLPRVGLTASTLSIKF